MSTNETASDGGDGAGTTPQPATTGTGKAKKKSAADKAAEKATDDVPSSSTAGGFDAASASAASSSDYDAMTQHTDSGSGASDSHGASKSHAAAAADASSSSAAAAAAGEDKSATDASAKARSDSIDLTGSKGPGAVAGKKRGASNAKLTPLMRALHQSGSAAAASGANKSSRSIAQYTSLFALFNDAEAKTAGQPKKGKAGFDPSKFAEQTAFGTVLIYPVKILLTEGKERRIFEAYPRCGEAKEGMGMGGSPEKKLGESMNANAFSPVKKGSPANSANGAGAGPKNQSPDMRHLCAKKMRSVETDENAGTTLWVCGGDEKHQTTLSINVIQHPAMMGTLVIEDCNEPAFLCIDGPGDRKEPLIDDPTAAGFRMATSLPAVKRTATAAAAAAGEVCGRSQYSVTVFNEMCEALMGLSAQEYVELGNPRVVGTVDGEDVYEDDGVTVARLRAAEDKMLGKRFKAYAQLTIKTNNGQSGFRSIDIILSLPK